MDLGELVRSLRTDESFSALFKDDKYIHEIAESNKDGVKKLKAIAKSASFLVRNNFNDFHCYNLTFGNNWEDKLEYIRGNYEKAFKPMGFEAPDIAIIAKTSDWKEKLEFVRENYESSFKAAGFGPSDISKIVYGKGWKEKLEYIKENHGDFIAMGFSGSRIARIVKGKEWKEKLEFIRENYEAVFKPFGFEAQHMASIASGKDGREKLAYLAEHYESILKPLGFEAPDIDRITKNSQWEKKLEWINENYPFYRAQGLRTSELAVVLETRDWKKRVNHWEGNKDLFGINIDCRISRRAGRYLAKLVFRGYERDEILKLANKCTYESLSDFALNVNSIAGIKKEIKASSVYTELKERFGYSHEEVQMYLNGINKNHIALLAWYNTGNGSEKRSRVYLNSLEEGKVKGKILNSDDGDIYRETPYRIAERDSAINAMLAIIRETQPNHFKLWQHFGKYHGFNVDELNPVEQLELDTSLSILRGNRGLASEVYQILAP